MGALDNLSLTAIAWMVSSFQSVLLFIYYIGGVKTYWKQLQYKIDFCDVTLVCDNKSIKTHKFMILNTVVNNVTVKKLQNVVCNNIYILFMKEFNIIVSSVNIFF